MNISTCTDRPILLPCGLKHFEYQVDPYIGCEHYCYYCYALALAETDWRKEIRVHRDLVGQLSKEIDGLSPQTIYMGYHTDPYQPCEAEYRQTRNVLTLFQERGFSASILTKSDLVTRDIDILKKMKNAAVSVSVAFTDNRTRKLFEANTMDTGNRIEALRQLKAAGIRTGALVCPVIPGITDAVRLVDMLEPWTDEVWVYGLSISDPEEQNWITVREILNRHFPELAATIESAILNKDHTFWAQLGEQLHALKKDRHVNLNIHL